MDVNQILAKAMSTSSEEEAIACLRMARKRGGQIAQTDAYNQHGAKHWYEKAREYYTIAKQVQEYYAMYAKARDEKRELENKVRRLKAEIKRRDAKWDYILPGIITLTLVCITVVGILSKG